MTELELAQEIYNQSQEITSKGKIIQKRQTSGVGLLLELAGLIITLIGLALCISIIFFLPGIIFVIVGVAIMYSGHKMANKLLCPYCGNKIDNKQVTLCPACRKSLR